MRSVGVAARGLAGSSQQLGGQAQVQLSAGGQPRGRSGRSQLCWALRLRARVQDLVGGWGHRELDPAPQGKRRPEAPPLSRTGLQAVRPSGGSRTNKKKKIKAASWCQGTFGATGETTCDPDVHSTEGSPMACLLASLDARFWPQGIILP